MLELFLVNGGSASSYPAPRNLCRAARSIAGSDALGQARSADAGDRHRITNKTRQLDLLVVVPHCQPKFFGSWVTLFRGPSRSRILSARHTPLPSPLSWQDTNFLNHSRQFVSLSTC